MEEIFKGYAKFGNPKSDGTQITLTNSDKWMKQAGVIDNKKITTTDTGICFSKFKSKTLGYTEYMQYIEALAKEKKVDVEEITAKMAKCAIPGTGNATKADKSGVVDRMTDTTKYTGTHKERFDKDGKGRGIEGRSDQKEDTGYVQGFKDKK
ncbi:tubulin polymerization-promoting protein homolog [Plutella xylostella]|uniref:tubulin polymerization-promoting protein homolog n=1 Tax=Plutella xylostella TaxID=51655 RepID=UPI0005D0C543|nr:tubulin polymerization-promoting protein homolog [Plutella xylostella]